MLQWIGMHFGDILVLLALGVIVVAILAGLRRNQKKGHCCGCSGWTRAFSGSAGQCWAFSTAEAFCCVWCRKTPAAENMG